MKKLLSILLDVIMLAAAVVPAIPAAQRRPGIPTLKTDDGVDFPGKRF